VTKISTATITHGYHNRSGNKIAGRRILKGHNFSKEEQSPESVSAPSSCHKINVNKNSRLCTNQEIIYKSIEGAPNIFLFWKSSGMDLRAIPRTTYAEASSHRRTSYLLHHQAMAFCTTPHVKIPAEVRPSLPPRTQSANRMQPNNPQQLAMFHRNPYLLYSFCHSRELAGKKFG
jgi:hypothetical protein